jgi:hypothetical protein
MHGRARGLLLLGGLWEFEACDLDHVHWDDWVWVNDIRDEFWLFAFYTYTVSASCTSERPSDTYSK